MAGYLIWVPLDGALTKDAATLLARAGLSDLVRADDALPMVCEAPTPCPDGGEARGQLLFFDDGPNRPGPMPALDRDKQTWRKLTPRDGLGNNRGWIGWWNLQRPGPGCLARRKMHRGETLGLGDGAEWLVPCIRYMPASLEFDDGGNYSPRLVDEHYQDVADRTWDLMARFQGSEGVKFLDYLYFASDLLGLNYRVNADILAALRVVRNDHDVKILRVAAGVPLEDDLDTADGKKNAPSSSNGAGG